MSLRRPLSRTRGCKRSQRTGLENFPGSNASVKSQPHKSWWASSKGFLSWESCPCRDRGFRCPAVTSCHCTALQGSCRATSWAGPTDNGKPGSAQGCSAPALD